MRELKDVISNISSLVESGSIPEDDAKAIIERATEEAYNTESSEDDNITIADAVSGINDFLEEKCKCKCKKSEKDDDKEDDKDEDDKDDEEDDDDVEEAVNALKLRVYEAFDNGVITEDEKASCLEYLDLTNYE